MIGIWSESDGPSCPAKRLLQSKGGQRISSPGGGGATSKGPKPSSGGPKVGTLKIGKLGGFGPQFLEKGPNLVNLENKFFKKKLVLGPLGAWHPPRVLGKYLAEKFHVGTCPITVPSAAPSGGRSPAENKKVSHIAPNLPYVRLDGAALPPLPTRVSQNLGESQSRFIVSARHLASGRGRNGIPAAGGVEF